MQREKFIILNISILLAALAGYISYQYFYASDYYPNKCKVEIIVSTPNYDKAELFFENNGEFSEQYKSVDAFAYARDEYTLSFEVPELTQPGKIRFDPGSNRGDWKIYSAHLVGFHQQHTFTSGEIYPVLSPRKHIKNYQLHDGYISFTVTDFDPILESNYSFENWYYTLRKKDRIHSGSLVISIFIFLFSGISFYLLALRIRLYDFTYQHAGIALFMIILIVPGLYLMVYREKHTSTAANLVYDKPVYQGQNLKTYIRQYTQYFETNYGFREELFALNGYYKYTLFNSSSRPQKVTVGKNGFVFYTDPIVWGDYQNKDMFTNEELEKIRINLEELHQWHKNRNIAFYITIFPNKADIYRELLPWNIRQKSTRTRTDQLSDYLKKYSYVQLIDVKTALMEKKKKMEIYYPGDTHWNFEGGLTAYEAIIDSMRSQFPGIFKINTDAVPRLFSSSPGGDLYAQLGINSIYDNREFRPVYDLQQKSYISKVVEYPSQYKLMPSFITKKDDPSLPRILVYRDSFFGFVQPYFSESFRECVYVWSTELSKETIETVSPDIVLYALIEGNIRKLTEENPEEIHQSVVPLNE